MDPWEKQRKKSGWQGGLIEWIDGNVAHLSVVFSWQLQEAYQRAARLKAEGYVVWAGGPAVAFDADFLADVAMIGGNTDALSLHNPNATTTSRGCIRGCPFCIVPKIEGDLVELDDWKPKPIICDNNPLACSRPHFNEMIDRLKPISGVDFNQGLDARLLTKYHAGRLAELDLRVVRLAWDFTAMETAFMRAFEVLRDAGFPKQKIRAYVLIGYHDTPEDALYRLRSIRELGAWPNPMRYQPLDAIWRNQFVGQNWTDAELKRYMRYWQNLRKTGGIPFEEFRYPYHA